MRTLFDARFRALLALTLAIPLAAEARPELRTRLSLAPGAPELGGPWRIHSAGGDRRQGGPELLSTLKLEGFAPSRTPGQPALPERELEVALHPDADLSTLELELASGPVDSLGERLSLQPNPPFRFVRDGRLVTSFGPSRRVVAGRDLDAYGGEIFPRQPVERVRISNRRGLLVLHLRYTPLRYRHAQGELLLDRATSVGVRYRLRAGAGFAPDRLILPFLERLENRDQARTWYRAHEAADTKTPVGYAIVIPDALAAASKKLPDFIKQKEALGYAVTVVKDADRAAIPVGTGGGDAERIRGWLQKNYKALNLKYALLVGNPDPKRNGVPMKLTDPMIHNNDPEDRIPTPSDFYYADLSGSWDLDGDGKAAEFPEDGETGGVDFAAEVYIGRIPIYDGNVAVLDSILGKTIAYLAETGTRAWRQRVLQPAAMLFFKNQYGDTSSPRVDGAEVLDLFKDRILSAGLSRTTLFDMEGLDPSKQTPDLPLTTANLIKEWQKGYGLVTMVGHGSSNGIFRLIWTKDPNANKIPDYEEVSSPPFLTYDDLIQLDDSRPSIVFHNSCSNGTPEDADNLGAGLLRHGAVATISSTRVAIVLVGGKIESTLLNLVPDAIDLLLKNDPISVALFRAKEMVSTKYGDVAWFTRLETSLYGDPSLSLVSCASDVDCDDGNLCTGKETCQAGQCVAGKPVVCAAEDPCLEAGCDAKTGGCKTTPRPDGEACDDRQFCTVDDRCKAGKCAGSPRCAAPGNPCVTATCDEQKKTCDVMAIREGLSCHEGTEREGTCHAAICQPIPGGCALGAAPSAGGLTASLLLLLALLALRRGRGR